MEIHIVHDPETHQISVACPQDDLPRTYWLLQLVAKRILESTQAPAKPGNGGPARPLLYLAEPQ